MSGSDNKLGPSIWSVSDGRAGNAAQTRAVVRALSETSRWMRIAHVDGEGHRKDPLTLQPRPPWVWIPSVHWPLPRFALPQNQRNALKGPYPTVWIAAGRRSAPLTKAMRKWSGGKTLTVQILDPKSDPSLFDLVVAPQHDGLIGDNVISTLGSPTHFAHEDIETAGQAFADLADEPGQSVLVVLGGDSKSHKFTMEDAQNLEHALERVAQQGNRLRMTTSRRTPLNVVAHMRAFADRIGAQFWSSPSDGPNPYLGWLLYSDVAIVTEDSANMLSDAAWHGLPVHIARISGGSPKFDMFHKQLLSHGCARWFEHGVDVWTYEPLREADRVADLIVRAILERHPQPDLGASEQGKSAWPEWMSD
ncbi:MAG: mitochondrial fission ELM1 family protein [Pseudomonadota bacterium]